jgi:hypothetical protein
MTPDKRNEGIQHRNRREPWVMYKFTLSAQDIENDDMIGSVNAMVVEAMIVILENQVEAMTKLRGVDMAGKKRKGYGK